MTKAQILEAIPHRPPFLFVDEVVERSEDAIKTVRRFDPSEYFFEGHYPDFPIVPGVIVCEAIYQAGAILLSKRAGTKIDEGMMPVLTRSDGGRFKTMVRPGDTIEVEVELVESVATAFQLKGKAKVNGKLATSTSFTCALVPKPEN
jgi:3-hydroxyacyl-[acyl-carrier-protein] dehydratase